MSHIHSRVPTFLLGWICLCFYIIHAIELLTSSPAIHLIWTCNVASLATALALLFNRTHASALFGMLVGLGNILWFIDIATGGELLFSSFLTHFGIFGIALYVMWNRGLPKGLWWQVMLVACTIINLSSYLGSPAENVNLSHKIQPGWEALAPSHGTYMYLITILHTAAAFSLYKLLRWLGFKTPSQIQSSQKT